MAEGGECKLHPAVAALAKGFSLVDGCLHMSDDLLAKHYHALAALPRPELSKAGVDVIALAVKFNRTNAGGTEHARVQLVAVASMLMTLKNEALERAGVSDKLEQVKSMSETVAGKSREREAAAGQQLLSKGIKPPESGIGAGRRFKR